MSSFLSEQTVSRKTLFEHIGGLDYCVKTSSRRLLEAFLPYSPACHSLQCSLRLVRRLPGIKGSRLPMRGSTVVVEKGWSMSEGSTADFEVSNPFKGAGTLKIRFARCKATMVWAAWRRNLTWSLSELDNVPPTSAPEITHGYGYTVTAHGSRSLENDVDDVAILQSSAGTRDQNLDELKESSPLVRPSSSSERSLLAFPCLFSASSRSFAMRFFAICSLS
ncbi:unnamed protein product [Zymoseptoria tritici ST99CH_3D7]|uniref:Uncharacterized protein n=1 Tax=Zymoseptoria tritici (strain ST99CH_3D7) TaxID=1276538 RepID=A0A1X7SA70_ZYMT9|nr:unnamed protein product [Zymoseptoria tritici ST99CH_3D7]